MKYLFTYFFFLLAIVSSSQNTDSLINIISSTNDNLIISKTYLELAKEYKKLEKDLVLEYADKGIQIAGILKNDSLSAVFYHTKAKIYDFHQEWNTAVLSYKEAIKYYKIINDSLNTPKCFLNIGATKHESGNFKEALSNYYSALKYFTKNKDIVYSAKTYNNIALIYKTQGNYPKALKIYTECQNLYEKSENKEGIAHIHQNIGALFWEQENYIEALNNFKKSAELYNELNSKIGAAEIYVNIGLIYFAKNDTASALKYYNKGIKLFEGTIHKRSYAVALLNKASIIYESGNFLNAQKDYLEALGICEKTGYNTGIMMCKAGLSKIYLKKGNRKKSIKYAGEAIDIAEKSSSLKYVADAYLILANNYESLHKYNYAFKNLKKYHIIRDSIYTLEKNKQINEIKTKYETEKKEAKISLLEKNAVINNLEMDKKNLEIDKKNKRIITISVFLFLTIGFLAIFFMLFLQKRKAYLSLVEHNVELAKKDIEIDNTKTALFIKENIKNKYSDSQLDEKHKKELIADIVALMEEEKYFLKSGFTINDLAEELDTNRSYISQIINEYFNTNFNNFINEYRVREARKLLISETHKNYSIAGIASSVGFQSKAPFNIAFKKFTGVTPSFFQKNT